MVFLFSLGLFISLAYFYIAWISLLWRFFFFSIISASEDKIKIYLFFSLFYADSVFFSTEALISTLQDGY